MWALRLLSSAGSGAVCSPGYRWSRLDASVLDLVGLVGVEPDRKTPRQMRALLAARLREVESLPIDRSGTVSKNVEHLRATLRLSDVEAEILAFLATTHTERVLDQVLDASGRPDPAKTYRVVATALAVDDAAVRRALGHDQTLRGAGLVSLQFRGPSSFPLTLMERLADVLQHEHTSARELMTGFVRRARSSTLTLADFDHVRADVEVLAQVLRSASTARARRRAKGVNVLLHGAPGTGKTELARALADHLGATLYLVADEDEDGDHELGNARLSFCAFAQRLLAHAPRTLLLFDEAEDAFPHRFSIFGPTRESTGDKAWTHRLLEEVRVPTLWVTNEIRQMDPATLRRFDVALELRAPPRSVRRKMLERRLDGTPVQAGSSAVERLAADERVTPADIDRAVKILRRIRPTARDAKACEQTLMRVVESSLAVRGARARGPSTAPPARGYDLKYVNASADLEKLVGALATRRAEADGGRASICLYGPPGSGKTAFALHLADRLAAPLQIERASDLSSKWVGETEQNIARAFERARDERAILFFDEAETFLQSRARAMHSWEISQVNELLTHMESYDGILLCATNFVESLDAASLRRFALKIRFDAMTRAQRWEMFTALARFEPEEAAELRTTLNRLDGVTPGDFAVAARRLEIVERAISGTALVAGLEGELALRPSARRVTGFSC